MDILPPRWRGLLLLGLNMLLLAQAQATTSASFQVTALVQAGCQVNNAPAAASLGSLGTLDYGTKSALSTATLSASLAGNSAITLACTPGVALNMQLDSGLHYSASRRLKVSGSTQTVAYQLFSDAGMTTAIPINTLTAVSYSNAANILLPIYGRVQLPGNLPAGVYQDQVTVTLQW